LRHQLEVLELVANLVKNKKIGVMMAMHDLNLAARFSDEMMMLHHGRIFCSGVPREVITPANIREVYGVEANVRWENGFLHIQPLRCADEFSPSH
jgi:iron complex transport system ATP-binding protein